MHEELTIKVFIKDMLLSLANQPDVSHRRKSSLKQKDTLATVWQPLRGFIFRPTISQNLKYTRWSFIDVI